MIRQIYYRQRLRCFILFINGGKVQNLMLLPLLSLITFSHVTDFSRAYAQKDKSKICNSLWGTHQLNASKNGSRMENYKPLAPFLQRIIWLKKGVNGIFLVMCKSFIYILLMSVAKLQVLLIAQALNMHLVNMGGSNTMGALGLFHDTCDWEPKQMEEGKPRFASQAEWEKLVSLWMCQL